MTREQLQIRQADLERQMQALGDTRTGLSNLWAEHARIVRELKATAPALERAGLVAVLQPVQSYWRSFIKDLADHAVQLALQFKITAKPSRLGKESAQFKTRTIFCPAITTEETYCSALHEMGHLEPTGLGDARQHRYVYAENGSLVAPLAEAASWAWALEHCFQRHGSRRWTMRMQNQLVQALATYKPFATPDEQDELTRVVAAGFEAVVPAPDTFEGRERRLEEMTREDRRRRRWNQVAEIAAEQRAAAEIRERRWRFLAECEARGGARR